MNGTALLVIAKEPLAGRVKTRLCPPCTPVQAAALARAALLDTLEVVARTPAARRVLVLDVAGGRDDDDELARAGASLCPPGFEVIAQRGDGLAQRLASAFEDVGQPALLVGMDTPQLTPALLLDGISALAREEVDSVLGPSLDGGYWSIGLRRPARAVFEGVPMSEPSTCEAQRRAILRLGLVLHEQPSLLDVDTMADARVVAREAPGTRFAAALAAIATAPEPADLSVRAMADGVPAEPADLSVRAMADGVPAELAA